ncbi:endonuclease/exonuclease/phosphatase family protein [Corynebacterium occultum]|nr:endonuclease/exonuclease/phosphatase family protein [Corynebacterium occultum]
MLIGPVSEPAIHVMSWNIRRRMPHLLSRPADRWNRRAPRLRMLLQEEKPTLLGAQEVLPDQLRYIRESLGENYRSVGKGRDRNGGDEACPIFYDTRRLELLDWAQQALSKQPDTPGSVSWGSVFPRILVWASFRERATSSRFLMLNTHLDHLSRRSRAHSALAIHQIISTHGVPSVLSGDFNDSLHSASLRGLYSTGLLADTWQVAQSHASEEWGTFPNYRAPRRGGRRIDGILASPAFKVQSTAINSRQYHGGWASDHLPVHALILPPENGART